MSLLMIGVRSSKDPRAGIQNGFWGIKYLIIIGGMIGEPFSSLRTELQVRSLNSQPISITVLTPHSNRCDLDVLWDDRRLPLHPNPADPDHRLRALLGRGLAWVDNYE